MKYYRILSDTELYETRNPVQIGNTISYPLYKTGKIIKKNATFFGSDVMIRRIIGNPLPDYPVVRIQMQKNNSLTGKFVNAKNIIEQQPVAIS